MHWDESLQTFTLLTIGDGIVTQVPALIISVATGIIVTRSASDTNLSQEVLRQITSFPKTLLLVAASLCGLLLLPGIPLLPTVTLLAVVLLVAWAARGAAVRRMAEAQAAAPGSAGGSEAHPRTRMRRSASSRSKSPWVASGYPWSCQRIRSSWIASPPFESSTRYELGLVLPRVRCRDVAKLAADCYEIRVDGVVVGRGEARADRLLAIHPAGDVKSLPGEVTRDPTYGLPAFWIEPAQREAALAARYTLVDARPC